MVSGLRTELAALAYYSWVSSSSGLDTAVLLVAHPHPVVEEEQSAQRVELLMRALAEAVGIDTSGQVLDCGPRLRLPESGRAGVRLGEGPACLTARVSDEWQQVAAHQGMATLVMGLDSMARAAAPQEVDAYVRSRQGGGRLLWGLLRLAEPVHPPGCTDFGRYSLFRPHDVTG
ncbi:hypothetical protein [Streptomyces sp. TR02-1]|uniref:hypothetical protein n=1 Tax=Streptomyces sp. TR02-1 TaxID=3385977 RepID=UPI0039A3384B